MGTGFVLKNFGQFFYAHFVGEEILKVLFRDLIIKEGLDFFERQLRFHA